MTEHISCCKQWLERAQHKANRSVLSDTGAGASSAATKRKPKPRDEDLPWVCIPTAPDVTVNVYICIPDRALIGTQLQVTQPADWSAYIC